jgi:hypothetical protein
MNDFTKTKIHFALALLGALFALHPFLQQFEDNGFLYLGYFLKLSHAYVVLAGLLALCVYCYGVTLIGDRPHSWLERLGNYSYALAIIVLPLYGGLYVSSLVADLVGQSHVAWAAPAVALGLGVGWFVLSQFLALVLRGRLGRQDRKKKIEDLAKREVAALSHARELFLGELYDLAVIEAWKGVETRMQRVLLVRGRAPRSMRPEAIIALAARRGIVSGPELGLLKELKQHWDVAVSSEPLSREAADKALGAARHVLSTIPLENAARGETPVSLELGDV